MNKTNIENILCNYPYSYITDIELKILLNGTLDSCYARVKRLTAAGKLLHIRRGLYCPTDRLVYTTKPHPFELAQHIYGPSCISMESALSFHGLIPEAVYSITSVCTKRSKEFNSPLGLFSYVHVPIQNFYTATKIVTDGSYRFFMARPWRAICDYVFYYKKDWNGTKPLADSLRINLEDLPKLQNKESQLLDDYYQNKRISKFLASIS